MGDNGTGDPAQYEVAAQMVAWHAKFPFDTVIMLGDNLYGSQEPRDFVTKFEKPYQPLLAAGVRFFASLGNHDKQTNVGYPPFNMGGHRYYTFEKKNVRFFALDSDFIDPPQLAWIEAELKKPATGWKVCYFHHPLYSDGGTHESQVDIRVVLEPLFVKYGVDVVYPARSHLRASQAAERHPVVVSGAAERCVPVTFTVRRRPPRASIRIRASCSTRSRATNCSSR